ncbi:MAG: hypothetical protein II252_04340 [Clostridia bacterium]|nr:hypothetical protein [Clostridia bacterium]
MTVTFFGHRDTPSSVAPELKNVLTALIEKEGATLFYVGNEGNFDRTVYDTLKELKEKYPFIEYKVVLAYLTKRKKDIKNFSFSETIYPEKLAETPLRFAISKRNSIMLNLADTVVTYVRGPGGGAADFKRLAESKGKRVINLCK